jgi:valyl-tRNA synthetase
MQSGEPAPITNPLDLAFLNQLRALIDRSSENIERYEHALALGEIERFFWRGLTDNYLELVKARSRSESDLAGRGSAIATLRLALNVLLRLFAPFVPYITEEIWSWSFAEESRSKSIHTARWPASSELPAASASEDLFETAIAALGAINKSKSESGVSVGRGISSLRLAANSATAAVYDTVKGDVLGAVRAPSCEVEIKDSLEANQFEVVTVTFEDNQ